MKEIEIVSLSDVIDNSGRTATTRDVQDIEDVLTDSMCWTDDITFGDNDGNTYFIDDLIGKKVKVGDKIFTVI
jgi:hypothetical protein